MRSAPVGVTLVFVVTLGGAMTFAAGQRAVGTTGRSGAVKANPTAPGKVVAFTATAYCHDGVTRSGADTHTGIAAADPAMLPVGSVVQITVPGAPQYGGVYTVLDTGSKVQGKTLDLFVRDCSEATTFGRKPIDVKVLRRGWSPKDSVKK